MANYESIYAGSSSLMPKYNPTGYQAEISHLGMSLDPRTANQLREVNTKINPGMKHLEISGVSAGVFESIPQEHLDEIRRLGKLTNVSTSVHAPIIEPSGVGEKGWDETNRIGAERQLESAILRSQKLDPEGNISVTVHSTAQLPEMSPRIKVKVRDPVTGEVKEEERPTSIWAIDTYTGKFMPIEPEKRFFPEEGEGEFKPEKLKVFDPEKELQKKNRDIWTEQLSSINRLASYGEDILDRVKAQYKIPDDVFESVAEGRFIDNPNIDPDDKKIFKEAQKDIIHGQIYLRDSYRHMKEIFNRAWENASDKDKGKLRNFAEKYSGEIKPGMETDPGKIPKLREMMEEGVKVLRGIENPKILVPLQDFVVEKSAETFANVATAAFNEFKNKAPVLNIENPPAGGGLSRAEDIKKLVEETRNKFVENLKNQGFDEGEARESAEKLIGATWDVGHINMLRKKGYSEKDIIKEAEKIAPFVKHVHLSDNFGLDHTELPMGMGNVPMKEIMKKLGEKGFEGKKIIEAGNWWQYFAEQGGGNPFRPTIQNFDSPIYTMKEGYGWSQLGGYAGYYMGHGPINPQVHHTIYGSGFANLPVELGGEIPGTRDRLSGTPMQ